MNKIYKLVWSKSKNMYVAVSEFAKSHTKSPSSRLVSRTVVAGVLASAISCGAVMPTAVYANTSPEAGSNYVLYDDGTAATITLEGGVGVGTVITNVAAGALTAASMDAVNGAQLYEVTQQFDDFQSALSNNNTSIARAQTDINNIKTQNIVLQSDVNTLKTQMETGFNVNIEGAKVKTVNPDSNFINFKAGDGISLTNDGSAIKVAIDADGVVASGNTGAITGGLAYTELRPTSGDYVSASNTTATNLVALDTKIGTPSDATGTYTDGTKSISENLGALDTALAGVVDSVGDLTGNAVLYDADDKATVTLGGTNGTKLTNVSDGTISATSKDAVNGTQLYTEQQARINADTTLTNKIGTLDSNGEFIDSTKSVSENLKALDDNLALAALADASNVGNNATSDNREAWGQALGTDTLTDNSNVLVTSGGMYDELHLASDGNYMDSTKTTAENLSALDTQLKATQDALDGLDGSSVQYDDNTKAKITLAGTDGTTIDNVKAGTLASDSKQAVNGAQLYAEQQARINADTALSDRIGTISSDGNYIQTGNSVYQNLQLLDTTIKGINTTMEDVVAYDDGNHAIVTFSGASGTKLTNLKPATLSASSTDAVIGAQLYATNQNIAGFAADITRNKNNIRDLNTSVSAALSSVSSTSALVDTLNNTKADTSLNNLSATGRQVIASAAANAVQEYMAGQQGGGSATPSAPIAPTYPDGSSVQMQSGENGNPVYEVTTGPNGETVSGGDTTNNVSSPVAPTAPVTYAAPSAPVMPTSDTTNDTTNDTTVDNTNSGDTGTTTPTTSTRGFAAPMMAGAGDASTNYVVYDDATAGTLTLEGPIGTGTKVTNVADGDLNASSTDAVNGHQLYEVTQQFDDFQSALSQNNTSIARAQTDINNIKNANIVLQSDVNTLKTQMEDGFNVTIDGALVKKVNPDSNYVNFINGDNVTIENDNGGVKVSVNATGVIAAGDTAPVSGGTVYNETRVASDGNYVDSNNSIAENVSALDTALKQVNDLAQAAAEVGVDANAVHYDGMDKATVTLAGTNGTTITNLKDGALSASSKDAVTGKQLFETNQQISGMSSTLGTQADGNYIDKTDTFAENMSALDTAIKQVNDIAQAAAEVGTDANAVHYDGTDKATVTLAGTNGTKITNLQDATLSATSKDAVSGKQLFATNERVGTLETNMTGVTDVLGTQTDGNYIDKTDTFAENISALDTAIKQVNDIAQAASEVGVDANAVHYDGTDKATVTLAGANGTTITNLKDGALSATSKDAVTGKQLYATNQNVATLTERLGTGSDGTFIDKDDSIFDNLKALDTGLETITANAGNAVQYDDNTHTSVTFGDRSTPVLLQNVADGTLSDASHDAVTGNQLFSTNTRVETLETLVGTPVDGNFISSTNSVYENMSNLDTQLNTTNTNLNNLNDTVQNMQTTVNNGADKNFSNITNNARNVIKNIAQNSIRVVGGDDTSITATAVDGALQYQINVTPTGTIAAGDTHAVSGDAVYQALQGISVNGMADNDLSNITDAGKQVIRDTVAEDLNGKANTDLDNITDAGKQVIRDTMAEDIAGRADTDLSNLTEAGMDVIRNAVASDLNGKTDTDLSNISDAGKEVIRETMAADLNNKANKDASNIDTDKWLEKLGQGQVAAGNTSLITGDTLYNETRPASDGAFISKDKAIGENLMSLDNTISELTATLDDRTVHGVSINSVNPDTDTNYNSKGATGDDAIAIGVSAGATGNEGIALGHNAQANGEQSIAFGTGNIVNGDHSGAFGDPNTVNGANSYVIGNDNTVDGNNTFVFSHNNNVTGNNSVVLGVGSDGSQDNVVSVGADGAERKIVHVADGEISANSKDAINGSQLFQVEQDFQNANGINVDKWTEKLGTGTMTEGNTGLVTGGTLYKVMETYQGTDLISLDKDSNSIRIGGLDKYSNVDTVDFRKADGTSRFISGVETNPNDPTSVANVGYVNDVSSMLVNNVNQGMDKMNTKIEKIGANAAALASLTPASFEGDEKWSLAASVGNYRSETAAAVGAFYKPTENVMMNIRSSIGNGENMFGAGVAVALSKGDVPGVTKRQLATAVNAQAQRLVSQDQRIAAQDAKIVSYEQRIAELENMVQAMASQMQK